MTSSLVGSEMCIRDSCRAGQQEGRAAGRPWRERRGGRQEDSLHCFCPVSYTHLTLPTICSV
eukprot:12652555-Prorocentrum_lima.AAC.1